MPGEEEVKARHTEPKAPPNFEPEEIVQEDLSLEPREVHERKKAERREKLEEARKKLPKNYDPLRIRVIQGKPTSGYKPQFPPHQISPVKMADDWERATNEKGRPPIGGAQDD